MPRKIKTTTFIKEIFISKSNYEKILMWALSEKEINFICFGKGKVIENVSRLSNLSRFPKNYSLESEIQRKVLVKEKKKSGFTVVACGHSHPKVYHDKHPSVLDVKYIEKDSIEFIAFPCRNIVEAWVIKNTQKETLVNKITIVIS